MKMLQGTEETTTDRKFLKSQMEKRRRERMNCSLEHLRTLLLQEPPQLTAAQQKLEKAEILEHTVLLLQSSIMGAGGGGGQRQSFQDGFSSCLQRAAQFLGPRGKGLRLGASLDARFAARFTSSDSDPTGVPLRTEARSCSSSLTQTRSILRMLRQKSKLRLQTQTLADRHTGTQPGQAELSRAEPGRAGPRCPAGTVAVPSSEFRALFSLGLRPEGGGLGVLRSDIPSGVKSGREVKELQ
ncbi:uncharacterized protein LOC133013848 [Limanda limanda]|uniref:uncharacterized protein LOC133013848 n=1 Tax=Limanda limanda TaxID=27771 RepID=UPI0029C7FBCE|nr:uncharacterized protein LOC133013848 [Limanda limanda]